MEVNNKMEIKMENKFKELTSLNVNEHTEKKKTGSTELTYLSWAWAWDNFKRAYPEANYKINKFENNLPYTFDEKTGYMVWTEITAGGLTYEMWLPVMDGSNKAMKKDKYSYFVKDYYTKQQLEKFVEPATMFDINKTIMRCLVKNMAMFGLGLYIYAGEDLPEGSEPKVLNFEEFKQVLMDCVSFNELKSLWSDNAKNFTNEKEKKELEMIKDNKKIELSQADDGQLMSKLVNKGVK